MNSLTNIINKLILPHEQEAIFGTGQAIKKGVRIGEIVELDPKMLNLFFSLLCPRIDKLIEFDLETNNGSLSQYGQLALAIRGFTQAEFRDLFSKFILENEFAFYPVFGQLKRRGKIVETEKDREYFISKYNHEEVEQNYLQAVCENMHPSYHEFFFEWIKYAALLPLKMLKMHSWIVGATGSGKTWMLTLIAHRMINHYKKYSFILIDVHGDIAKVLKRHKHFAKNPDRLVYLNPFFKDGYTFSFNFFSIGQRTIKHKIHLAENLITAFQEVLERDDRHSEVQVGMLEKCIYFLLDRNSSTLEDLEDLLACRGNIFEEAREWKPEYFNDLFAKPNNRTRISLSDRVARMLNSPVLRQMLGGNSTFDLGEMNGNKVFIFDLGDLSDLTAKIYGKFLIAAIKSHARFRQKDKHKGATFLMLDEAHVLMSGTFNYILEQLRGFGLHCILSHQFPNQLGNQKETVRRNCAIRIVGGFDEVEDINEVVKIPKGTRTLKDYEFYLKVKHRRIEIFKTPSKFIKKRRKYEMTDEQERAIDRVQLKRYYRVFGQSEQKNRRVAISEPKQAVPDAPKPMFQLKIKPKDV
ncbi:MAG: DUF87 domain-containing protein [Bacteroidota bacterium]